MSYEDTVPMKLTIPDGYYATGEYRSPEIGEYYLACCRCEADLANEEIVSRYPILKKRWEAPGFLPKGHWLYRSNTNSYWVSTEQPEKADFNRYLSKAGSTVVSYNKLCKLYGVEPAYPEENCVQII